MPGSPTGSGWCGCPHQGVDEPSSLCPRVCTAGALLDLSMPRDVRLTWPPNDVTTSPLELRSLLRSTDSSQLVKAFSAMSKGIIPELACDPCISHNPCPQKLRLLAIRILIHWTGRVTKYKYRNVKFILPQETSHSPYTFREHHKKRSLIQHAAPIEPPLTYSITPASHVEYSLNQDVMTSGQAHLLNMALASLLNRFTST